jgi:hypothetical protein
MGLPASCFIVEYINAGVNSLAVLPINEKTRGQNGNGMSGVTAITAQQLNLGLRECASHPRPGFPGERQEFR